MELVGKFFNLYSDLLSIIVECDFVLFIAFMFIFAMIVNIVSYFLWGRY